METIQIRKAVPEDLNRIVAFYNNLIDAVQDEPYSPKWQKDIYPEAVYLGGAISREELYIAILDGDVAGAMILNRDANEGFWKADWPVTAQKEEILMLHTLAVSPDHMRRGIGQALVQKAIHVAEEEHDLVIRLDVIQGNYPAANLYRRMGFYYVETMELFYDDCGWYPFELFEYAVKQP